MKSTTVLTVRRDGQVAIGADGQVTMGETIVKADAVKIRKLMDGKVIVGFAGSTADAFSLHLASYRRQQDAVDGWAALRAQAPGVLSGLMPGTSRFTRGADGEFIRLKAGPIPTRSEANALCAQLRAGGLYCEVQPYAGTVPF